MKNPAAYRNKIVVVQGIYWQGLRETCTHEFVTGYRTWPSAFNLADSASASNDGHNLPFNTDRRSWDELDELVLREARAGRREEIWVNIRGKIETPESYIRRDGKVVGGYGHLGVYPVQLIVQRIVSVRIEQRPTYNYGEMLEKPHATNRSPIHFRFSQQLLLARRGGAVVRLDTYL